MSKKGEAQKESNKAQELDQNIPERGRICPAGDIGALCTQIGYCTINATT